ncbi:MAG: hypothetical protein ACLQKA_11775 [Bryobacteraceae bacterium]
MSGHQEVTYTLDFEVRRRRGPKNDVPRRASEVSSVPRIARLMALAIRLEGLIREQAIPDYAAVARRGRVTRARMTQIMKLLDLAPDLQEQILFLPSLPRLNERNLRPIVRQINWHEQRRLFRELTNRSWMSRDSA